MQSIERRYYHSSIIAGNWIYIDGGETLYPKGVAEAVNMTAAIDLSKDWTNSSLSFIYTPRPSGSLALNFQVLWWDTSRNIIYCFGGERSSANSYVDSFTTPPDSIWSFTLDNQGGGLWEEVIGPISNKTFPSSILRPAHGISAYDDKTAFYLGGFTSWGTSPEANLPYGSIENSPGLLTFDFNTLTLTNTSKTANPQVRNTWVTPGSVLNVPFFLGDEFLIVFGGGSSANYDALEAGGPFNNITIYNKDSQTWTWQIATGSVPEPRISFCAVGVWDDTDESFEVFVHGGILDGSSGPNNSDGDQLYILTLPAFQWFQANYSSMWPRALHTCHSTNNNQMVLIGGLDPTVKQFPPQNQSADPWMQQIGVFDMTALKWKESYESNADPYRSPAAVKQFYLQKYFSRYPSSWTSTNVQALFQPSNGTLSPPNPPNISSTQSVTSQPSSPPSTSQTLHPPSASASASAPSHSHLANSAIAGISVGCAITLILFLSGILISKRYRQKKTRPNPAPSREIPEIDGELLPGELCAKTELSELRGNRYSGVELPAFTR